MRLTILAAALTVAAAWIPGGLIHQGQQRVNPRAESILGQLAARCDPTTPEWRGCQ